MDKNTEEKIFRESYKLFIRKPYDAVTVRELEKATGMTRGAIFYYVKDKEQLFHKVLDRYFLNTQNLYSRMGEDILEKDITFKQFIELVILSTEKTRNELYTLADITNDNPDSHQFSQAERLYIGLILYAGYYLDDFPVKMDNIFVMERNTWSFFIQKGIEKGEIKPNTNVRLFGELFSSIRIGKAFKDSLNNGLKINELGQLYMELYSKIKV